MKLEVQTKILMIKYMIEVIEEYGKYQFNKAIEEMRAISELDSDVDLPVFEHES